MLSAIFCFMLILSVNSNIDNILIIISYDAFGYDYLERGETPFLDSLRNIGTTTEYVKNVFPTKTFVIHYSMATGVYPEVHGVVGNSLYDPLTGKILSMKTPELYSYNDEIIPIWILNEMVAEDRRSGCMMWPGSVYSYANISPTYFEKYNKKIPFNQRVDIVMSWLTSEKPPNLVMFYSEQPDSDGHAFGTNSKQVHDLIKQLDNAAKYLYDNLKKYNLLKRTNVIHTGDHGMINIKPAQFINITTLLEPDSFIQTESSPLLLIYPKKESDTEDMLKILKQASRDNGHFQIYGKGETLDRWHYRNNRRIPPIIALADLGYGFDDMYYRVEYFEDKWDFQATDKSEFGMHGYDNGIKVMYPYFVAYGPSIKVNHKVSPFSTLDLYSLFCALLEIEPRPNNGSFDNVRDIIKDTSSNPIRQSQQLIIIILMVMVINGDNC